MTENNKEKFMLPNWRITGIRKVNNHEDMILPWNLNSCDELIEFMIEHYEHPYRGNDVCFQGDFIEFDGFCVNLTLDSILAIDAKHPGYAFIISPWRGNWIQLSVFKGFGNMDQRPAAIIPAYVKDELIATITGRW